jgi:AraC-like DNA-binding protein
MDTPFSLPSSYVCTSTRSWGRTQAVTIVPDSASQGRREFFSFHPGFYMSLGDVRHVEGSREIYPVGDFIKLHYRLEGESLVGQAGGASPQTVQAMSVSTLYQPPGSSKEEVFRPNIRERSLTLCCSRSFLADALGLEEGERLSGPFADFALTQPANMALSHFPMSALQSEIVQGLLAEERGHAFRGIYAEAKAFELLHDFLSRRVEGARESAKVRQLRERLHPLKEFIDTHLLEPLEMQELARRFGFSESSLARSFRQAYGMALFEYVQSERLQHARSLLEAGQMSVTQVALSVGYGHVANFSTAFKRHFLLTPQAAQRAVVPGS